MYGCSNAYMIFGCNENNRERVIDNNWLYRHWQDIHVYALDVVRNCLGEACYGIRCSIDINTGNSFICDEDKQIVQDFFEKFITYNGHDTGSRLGYYLCVSGDYTDEQHNTYVLYSDEDEDTGDDDEVTGDDNEDTGDDDEDNADSE